MRAQNWKSEIVRRFATKVFRGVRSPSSVACFDQGRPELGVYRANLRIFNTLVPVGEKLTRFTMHPLENVSLILWPISLPR